MRSSIRPVHRESGSILPAALTSISILAMFAAAALYKVTPRLGASYHSACWSEALQSAEAGADMALKALNDSVTNPATAWAAWSPSDATTFPKTWVPAIAAHGGDGNTKVFCRVTVDNAIVDAAGTPWLRVRSMGVAELPSSSRAGIEAALHDATGAKHFRSVLRRDRFLSDLTAGALHIPQVARTVEAIAAPPNSRIYTRALTMDAGIALSSGFSIDSFDSSDPVKSTSGQYDPTKRQSKAAIASNAAGSASDLNHCQVRGDASSNSGEINNDDNIQGEKYDNFFTPLPAIESPSWGIINSTPTAVTNPAAQVTLVGGPAGAPQNYKLSGITINNSAQPLILATHATGQQSYINIWVTGTLSVSSTGFIQQQPGVHVQVFSEGSIALSGGGWQNQTANAANLVVYGITPNSGTRTMIVSGGGTFLGVFNGGPSFDLTISGGATFIGSAIGRSADCSGSGSFHYDEALAGIGGGIGTKYRYASWIEDIR